MSVTTAGLAFCCEPVNIVCACVCPPFEDITGRREFVEFGGTLIALVCGLGGAEQSEGVCGTRNGVHLQGLSKARRRIDNRSVAADEVSTAWDCG